MEQSLYFWGYGVYLVTTITLTLIVSRILFKNSITYMNDIFQGRTEIAQATNTLFKTGFYLINIGCAFFCLKIYLHQETYRRLIEAVSLKLGFFIIYLGVMLFINLFFFFRGKKKAKVNRFKTKALE